MTNPAQLAQMVADGAYDHICPAMPHFILSADGIRRYDKCPLMGRHYSNQTELDKARKTA